MNEFEINTRINALADYLGLNPDEIKESSWSDVEFETPMGDYMVVEEDEAYELAKEDVLEFYDEFGIEGFSEYAQEYILDNFVESDWFEDALRESEEFYVDDIRDESAWSDEYETRLEEEMAEAGVSNEEDFIDWLVDNAGDPIEYYRGNFGNKEFSDIVKANNLIDEDAMAKWVIAEDGVANSLARYDGKELELGNGLYAYRTN